MPVLTTAASIAGGLKGIGFDPLKKVKGLIGGIFGGGGGESGPNTRPGTVAYEIDDFDKGNNYNSRTAAKKIKRARMNGKGRFQIARIVADELGYPDPRGVMRSQKFQAVWNRLNKVVDRSRSASAAGGSSGGLGKAFTLNKFLSVQYIGIAAGLGIIGFFIWKNS